MLRSVLATCATVLMATSVVACGGDDEPKSTDSETPAATGTETASASATPTFTATPFDPPKKFEVRGQPMGLPDKSPSEGILPQTTTDRVALAENVAVAADSTGLYASDLSIGTQLWQRPAVPADQAATVTAYGPTAPVTTTLGGRTLVVVAFGERVKGAGTTKDHVQTSLQAVDPADGTPAWTVELPGSDRPGRVLIDEESGLIAVGSYAQTITLVDANAHRALWTLPQYELVAFGKGIIAARPDADNPTHGLVGLDAHTKQVRWRALPWAKPTTEIRAIGAAGSFIVASTKAFFTDPHSAKSWEPQTRHVIDLTTGKTVTTFKGNEHADGGVSCEYDGVSVLACAYMQDEAFAIDTTSGRKLWWFDSSGSRVPPVITAAFHGVVYAKAQNGPAMLDAKTGQDLGNPGAVAMTVDEYGAASYEADRSDDVILHPAIG